MEERRSRDRYHVWAVVQIAAEGFGPAPAVTHDASGRGVALLTRLRLDVGAEVVLTIQLSGDNPRTIEARGRVVRSGNNADDPEGLWPVALGVELAEAVPGFEDELEPLAKDHPLGSPRD